MGRKEILLGLIGVILLFILLSPFTSPWPDGLEKLAKEEGFRKSGEVKPLFPSPMPGYVLPNLRSRKLATLTAGIFGVLVVFGLSYALAVLLRRRRS